ncbi:SGNH/GDSL hydrolase family protein [Paenibacillus dendritiformis]|uniref:SGNH/GDSL hydrolase family protein n=1 Tax=Paenibacillus dendritiformis TaxID=130049 RepID=UPI00387E084E
MNRLASRAGLLLLIVSAALMAGFTKADEPQQATWVWQAERIVSDPEQLLSFAKNNQIDVMYLHIHPDVPESAYRQFVRQAAKEGIEVHALAGDPTWALPDYRGRMMDFLHKIQHYNAQAAEDERFRGIHLDIEPYVLPQWEEDANEIIHAWMDNLDLFLEAGRKEGSLEFGVDIPVWFDGYAGTDPSDASLAESVMKRFDYTTLMAYRHELEGGNGILALIREEMAIGDRLGTKVLVGMNAKPMPGEEHTTFANQGAAAMNDALKQIGASLAGHSSYGGTAVHDYRYWNDLLAQQPNVPDPAEPEPKPDPEPAPDPKPDPEPNPNPNPEPGQPEPAPDPDWVPDASPIERVKPIVGTYIWRAELAIHQPDEIIAFARDKGINLLYVRLDLEQPYEVYRSLVKKAHEAGIEMHAMGGHPGWALQDNAPRIRRLIDYVKKYNRAAEADERFHGIHLDVEPYVLPDWSSRKDEVLRQWTANMKMFVEETKRNSNLETSIDLAVWLDRTLLPDEPELSVSEWMIRTMDHVSLMAFRNTADGSNGIAAVVSDEMRMADRQGKPLIVTVEMKQSPEGGHISFFDKGSVEMEKQLSLLPELLGEFNAYIGNAVHAYDYWKEAKP